MSWTPLLCIALFFPLVAPAEAQSIYPLPSKKIIELGWDVPSPAYFLDNFRTMEHLPFDGVIIRLPADAGGGKVFEIDGWVKATGAARERELRIMREMPGSEKLTSNFLALYGASTMDWFSDADWGKVLENARFCARAAKASRCKGICWDPEPYSGINPWRYKVQPGYEQHTFAEYEQMARKRGAQFMRALQDEFPGLTIFSLRFLSDFQDGSPF